MHRIHHFLLTPVLVAQLSFVLLLPRSAGAQLRDDALTHVEKYLSKHFQHHLLEEESRLALAIGAPEIIRYQYFRDFLETSSLQLLYVNYGGDAADFSIGPLPDEAFLCGNAGSEAKSMGIAGGFCSPY